MEVRGYSVDIRYSRVCIYTYVMELIGECPKENAEECAKRLEEVMKNAARDKCDCPFKCDADISKKWYYNENCAELKKMLNDYIEQGLTSDDAFSKLCDEREEFTPSEIREMLG